ncbi:MAG: phosphoglucosamine mutase [Clostridiales bacterium]|nr:phosphoglucosamine mutase [Clostridiales bacterium]
MGRLFGTDGVRGIANTELTCERAMQIGRAAAEVLSSGRRYLPTVLVGMDTRISSEMLASALTAGLCSVGADVINLGVVPTPAVAYLVGKYKAHAGVMISASHNPYEFNGIKIFNEDGYKLEDELEERIESVVLDGTPAPKMAKPENIGRVMYADNAVKDYIDHLRSTALYSLDGMNIALDCANGSASRTAKLLFEGLGANCHMLSYEPNGININNNCGSTHLENLRAYVLEHDLDAGVAFDGDADRCLCVDNEGNDVDGDMIMAIAALDMKSRGKLNKNAVVGTIMTNFGFSKFCADNDIRFVATKVGDRYVLEEMLLEDYYLGGEQSGHVIFRDFSTTGDGQLTAVQLLSQLKRTQVKLSEAAKVMTRYPQFIVNINCTTEEKLAFYTDYEVKSILEEAKKAIGDSGRLIARPSGTEPLIRVMAEGDNSDFIKQIAEETSEKIKKQLESYR